MILYKPGAKVNIGDGITGIVRQVNISETGVAYEIAWWLNQCRNVQWFNSSEVEDPKEPSTVKIGFKQ